MKTSHLKNCPFCDSSALHRTGNGIGNEFVECSDCGASGPAGDHSADYDELWNRRAVIAALVGPSAEQSARDLLERMGVPDAQTYSSGDLVELANEIAKQAALVEALKQVFVNTKEKKIRDYLRTVLDAHPAPEAASAPDARQFQAGVREGYERAAKALGERASGWRQHGEHTLEEEVLQCRSMLHDQKPAAPTAAKAGDA